MISSLKNSLPPSASGCSKPKMPARFGPRQVPDPGRHFTLAPGGVHRDQQGQAQYCRDQQQFFAMIKTSQMLSSDPYLALLNAIVFRKIGGVRGPFNFAEVHRRLVHFAHGMDVHQQLGLAAVHYFAPRFHAVCARPRSGPVRSRCGAPLCGALLSPSPSVLFSRTGRYRR